MKQTERKKLATLAALFALCAVLLPAVVWAAYSAEVPRTGQATSYAAGDDGAIEAGVAWPDPRFTDRGDGTVSDNLTGLVWAKNANLLGTDDADNDTDGTAGDGLVAWQHALDYIKKLNRENYLGYSDWRLPNRRELRSLADYGHYYFALRPGHPFLNVKPGQYWTSTSLASSTSSVWLVGFYYGLVVNDGKGYSYSVWPVRSGQCGSLNNSVICLPKTGQTTCYDTGGAPVTCAETGEDGEMQAGVDWPDPRFTANGDTVTDNLTGLVWAKNANLLGTDNADNDTDDTAGDGKVTWQHALDYIKKLNRESYLGQSDWRLPNVNELESLVHADAYNPALPAHPFLNVQAFLYWSSTTSAEDQAYAWIVNFTDGVVHWGYLKTYYFFVWPVRSGQCRAFGDLVISKSGTGAGTVTSADGKIDCGSDCSETYTSGTEVTLTATADAGSVFASWSGGGCSGTDNCTLTVNDNLTVTANFDLVPTTTTTQPTTTTTIGGATTTTTIGGATTTTTIGGTTTTTTAPRRLCPAKQVLGADNPQLENLRDFRDSKLAQSAVGRKVIQIYYNNAGSIDAALERSPALRAAARRVLEAIAPVLGR